MTSLSVTILLATFNGAHYLPEQLNSLALQIRRPDKLVVRDDGSSDNSIAIVQEWGEAEGIAVEVIESKYRLGPAQSFLSMLRLAGPAHIYMFCDQDDVWLPDKINRAISRIIACPENVPHLHATHLIVVDQQLKPIREARIPKILSFESAVCENVLTGCTMAFNAALAKRLASVSPSYLIMHDWWAYLVASGCGYVSFDEKPTLLYRQHTENTLGAGPIGLSKLKLRLGNFIHCNSLERSKQLHEFLKLHSNDLNPTERKLAEMLTLGTHNPLLRLKAALFAKIHRQSKIDTISTRLAVLSNRF